MKKYYLGIGITLLALGIIFLLYFSHNQFPQDIYTGKEAFWTQEEYTTFREFLARDSVKDFEITILQSEMPIIVKLKSIAVERYSYCPYGKMNQRTPVGAPWMFYTGIPLATVGLILMFKAPE